MAEKFQARYIKARKAYIESRFLHLNPMQRKAVMQTEGPVLVLAGAGSGKTTVLINRIYNLLEFGCASDSEEIPYNASEEMLKELETHGDYADEYAALRPAAPWQILAITFTNKAASELKTRLERLLGDAADELWACTFHSACVRILRRDAERLGYTGNFTIYDTADSQSLVKHVLKDLNLDEKYYPPRAVLTLISRAKDARIFPDTYIQNAKSAFDLYRQKTGEIYKEYMHRLRMADAMDFDDLLLNTVLLLEKYEDVRDYWQQRFHYVLIDEYQDTNLLQYQFSALMAGKRNNICVVGDDDQSIYKFRGATIENILSFEKQYPGCRTIRLEQNYRSTGIILDAANAVIRNNTERKGKNLWTEKDAGDRIVLTVTDNEREEAQQIASRILTGYGKGENWRDYAVLYRKNAQSNAIEFALKRNGIPYRIFGGTRFFDRAEVKDILAYMCVVASPADDLRLERIVNVPPRGIGSKSLEAAMAIAADNNCTLFEILSQADQYEELSRSAVRMRQFSIMIRELQAFSELNTPDLLFDEIIEKTGYIQVLEEKNTVENTTRIENVRELKSTILNFMDESEDATLNAYLANVALYTDLDNYDRDASAVTLMTMHASKGLEFPHVFIAGMEETIFPGIQAIGESEEMEEERRLCYVAITRAMKTLELLCAKERMIFGRTIANKVSRFVEEIPEEDIEKNIPKGYGWREKYNNANSYAKSESKESLLYSSRGMKSNNSATGIYGSFLREKTNPEFISLNIGDRVIHKSFREGVVTNMTPMGNDYLLEIDFVEVGGKKLMLRAASRYMEKL